MLNIFVEPYCYVVNTNIDGYWGMNCANVMGALQTGQLLADVARDSQGRRQSWWKECRQGRDITTWCLILLWWWLSSLSSDNINVSRQTGHEDSLSVCSMFDSDTVCRIGVGDLDLLFRSREVKNRKVLHGFPNMVMEATCWSLQFAHISKLTSANVFELG